LSGLPQLHTDIQASFAESKATDLDEGSRYSTLEAGGMRVFILSLGKTEPVS